MTDQPAFDHEVGADGSSDELPAYAPMLAAYRRTCASELQQIIATLPLAADAQVLDMACGDGAFSVWLAQRISDRGSVIGLDIAPAYLRIAAERAREHGVADRIRLQTGDIARLPFGDNTFDLVWCAHSLYSLPDPIAALREMRRVVRSGGTVAILENDTLHHMVLPWPVEVELAVRQAQLAALQAETDHAGKFYIGRDLSTCFRAADLINCHVQTWTIDRGAPPDDDLRVFLSAYLHDLRERSAPHLDRPMLAALNDLLDPNTPQGLLDRPDFFVSLLEILACGVKP